MKTEKPYLKTDYPDLERLPDTNWKKHLLNFIWNWPRVTGAGLYTKYILKAKIEKESANLKLKQKELEIEVLKAEKEYLETIVEISKLNKKS